MDRLANPLLLDLIFDLANYSIFCSIFFYLYKKSLINLNLFLVCAALMATPFLLNNSIIQWYILPDQSKYLGLSHEIRSNFNNLLYIKETFYKIFNSSQSKIFITSYLYASSPLINIETFKSIGLLNRFLLIGTTLFFFRKHMLNPYVLAAIIFSPSLTLYSSVSLRDVTILIVMIWFVYFFVEKKYLLSLIMFSLIYLMKSQNLLILSLFIILYLGSSFKVKKVFFIPIIIVSILIIIFAGSFLIEELNAARKGLYLEEHGRYKGLTASLRYEDLVLNFRLVIISLKSFFYFLLSPVTKLNTLSKMFICLEAVMLYGVIIHQLISSKKSSRYLVISWFLIFIFSMMIYGIATFNDGTIHRFRTPLLFFVLFGFSICTAKKR